MDRLDSFFLFFIVRNNPNKIFTERTVRKVEGKNWKIRETKSTFFYRIFVWTRDHMRVFAKIWHICRILMRTATHSALKLPLNMDINETPACNLSKNCAMAKVLQQCKLIIWYKCTMAHKKTLKKAFDRIIQDLQSKQNRFGSAMILLLVFYGQRQPMNLIHIWSSPFYGNTLRY